MEDVGPGLCSFESFQAGHVPEDQAAQWEEADLTPNLSTCSCPHRCSETVGMPTQCSVCLGGGSGTLIAGIRDSQSKESL